MLAVDTMVSAVDTMVAVEVDTMVAEVDIEAMALVVEAVDGDGGPGIGPYGIGHIITNHAFDKQ